MNMKTMPDMELDLYSTRGSSLYGVIRDGSLHITSEVWGDDYDSEKHYVFTKEDTSRLFSLIEVDEFIEACKEGHTSWLEKFLGKNDIHYRGGCI